VEDPIAAASAAAAPILLLHLSTLRLLIEDPKSAEFAAGTEVSRLRGGVGTTAAHSPQPGSAAAGTGADGGAGGAGAPSGLLSGGAGGVGVVPPRSVAAAVVDLCALVLKGHGGTDATSAAASSSSDAAAEGLACYLAHRLLHAHCARGAPPLPLRAGWVSLWRGAAASLRRASAPGALARPRVPRLAAQCLNLLAFALAAGGTLLPAASDAEALVGVIIGTRQHVLRLGAAAARAGLLDPADVASLAPPDESEEGGGGGFGNGTSETTTYALVAPPDAHAASGANAAPLLRMRPLLDVFAVFGDVAPAKVPRFINERYGAAHLCPSHARARARAVALRANCVRFLPSFGAHLGGACSRRFAGLLPKVTLDRLDAGYAAGGSTSEAAASATAALSRALVAAAAPSPHAPPRTGELDAALGSTRAGEGGAAATPRLSTADGISGGGTPGRPAPRLSGAR
jgi:hypothetical protein